IEPAKVRAHLGRLRELGAIRVAPPRPAPSRRPSLTALTSEPPGPGPRPSGRPSAAPTPPAPAISSVPLSGEIDASLSISVELQARILELSAKLSDLDHFQVLGLPMSAERAQVKRAYFSMIGTFHPDTYFGKQLGPFTKRMER